ncbi:2-succinyl-6-hydroxy-2,4-cyclohexadiene-1-carboxylate synthase [Vibrio aestuarianus]|uniref:2-succinyl-6-hydroxy-2, 4-cyclohexadiene-1-carboxylate synthase n=1 Tax=Vibrio aestuarianus TaxID=28171 RepID=UPI00237C711C|nr:2-succinyl-6-hydroxy-2,4-cyclohexadiene-1-carboxylate synthase [Vibrio aestuarianus]MDE1254020.1 2-succinyl-6-hydroxy-2,4-cyclohexadiene-1-carboxylate synthase [Vibrio aestuarianus]
MPASRRPQPIAINSEPVLVFVHGLLGCGDDWLESIHYLTDYRCVTIDLPGHGISQSSPSGGFEADCNHISNIINRHIAPNTPIVLIGYSLGGRMVMYGVAMQCFNTLNIQGVVIEGGNFGLQNDALRSERLASDTAWSERFKSEPIEQVLGDWYQQAVFSSLNHEQRQTLITKRSANLGAAVAQTLVSTSLAKQPYLLDKLKSSQIPMCYVCGENDTKFTQLAKQSGLRYYPVPDAGHNVHQEQPQAFAEIIREFIRRC